MAFHFEPDGNDLKRVMYYYGIEIDNKIVCPFHDDNRPSCHVNFDEGIFHCFACEVGGNAFDFVKFANSKISDLNQLILYHAIINSDKVSNLKLSKLHKSKSSKQHNNDSELDSQIAYDYYYGLKSVNWKNINSEYKDYMIKRGFSESALNLCKAKLTIVNNSYPLIFPIYDNGTFKGYVCRTTDKHVEKNRKYLYNKGFSRRNTIGGDYNSKVVIVCEGYMDALKFRQFGLNNVIAIFGWKITSEQIAKLKAIGVETLISALDLDKTGIEGTKYLKKFFDVVEFVFPKYIIDNNGKIMRDKNGNKKKVKDPGDITEEQFKVSYKKTRKLYRSRRN